ncbi:MAG: hypothetical protein HZA79_12515 [Sphingobacteriales bacterium]|nr:hypothetical protein [Sphingobacteriales bacterium]
MRTPFNYKRLLLILLPVLALAFIAGVPVSDDKTVLEQIIAAFPSGEADPKQQEEANDSLKDIWAEMQKLAAHNNSDSISMSGRIRLYDNLFEEGIQEQQAFTLEQAGENQWFHLDSFDRIQLAGTYFLVDHPEKEITIQMPGAADSMVKALQMMDPEKMKKILIKDGTTAELSTGDGHKILSINPGMMDAVNRYDIIYDSSTYEIKKFRIYYTNTPYQDYRETGGQPEKTPEDPARTEEEEDMEMNVTEYVLEFEIQSSQKKCGLDFLQNSFYRVSPEGDVIFTGRLAGYKKTSM